MNELKTLKLVLKEMKSLLQQANNGLLIEDDARDLNEIVSLVVKFIDMPNNNKLNSILLKSIKLSTSDELSNLSDDQLDDIKKILLTHASNINNIVDANTTERKLLL
ncbi:hypothetical protein [Photobacterium leiognathi]|uniref:hypothetical protein n=1 Tax=Photobacterium leiognathi TaxID=553611 RepID=UPI0029827CD3|nr:hypothetical protein [Photobacterium leiognathi]